MPGDVLPCCQIDHGQVRVKAEEAGHHEQQQCDDAEPDHQQWKRATRPKLRAQADRDVEKCTTTFDEEAEQLRNLGDKEPIEEYSISLADTGANPRTMVIMRPYTFAAFSAVLGAERLMHTAELAPSELLPCLKRHGRPAPAAGEPSVQIEVARFSPCTGGSLRGDRDRMLSAQALRPFAFELESIVKGASAFAFFKLLHVNDLLARIAAGLIHRIQDVATNRLQLPKLLRVLRFLHVLCREPIACANTSVLRQLTAASTAAPQEAAKAGSVEALLLR